MTKEKSKYDLSDLPPEEVFKKWIRSMTSEQREYILACINTGLDKEEDALKK